MYPIIECTASLMPSVNELRLNCYLWKKNKKTKKSMTFLWEIWQISFTCMGNNNCGIPVLPVRETSDLSSRLTIRFKSNLHVNK